MYESIVEWLGWDMSKLMSWEFVNLCFGVVLCLTRTYKLVKR